MSEPVEFLMVNFQAIAAAIAKPGNSVKIELVIRRKSGKVSNQIKEI